MVDLKSHEPALQKILLHFGKLDILISNAGGFVRGDWHEIDLALDKELFEVNVFSVINMNRLVVKHFLQVGGGQIAVMFSASGKVPLILAGPYTASKYAIQGYFNALRGETYGKNIDVTLICPGLVQTSLVHGALASQNGEASEGTQIPWEVQATWMSPERCAYLSLVAIANRLNESWVSNFPTIPYMHFALHFPVISQFFDSLIFPPFIRKVKSLIDVTR
ncbi:unnamed protein product [Allacma fusca]|uniref:Uncharacterized protein n=1 Tax=Allacma fusca TaxID=39272 RepID=A0A8J2Q707_9HEXA|nr:unnamed protein product [Allacma fusca]